MYLVLPAYKMGSYPRIGREQSASVQEIEESKENCDAILILKTGC